MQNVKPGSFVSEPVIDRSEKSGSIVLLLALATGLVAAAVALALLPRQDAAPYVQILLGVLAVIGVFSLFAGAIGLIRFSGKATEGHDLTQAILQSLSDGLLVTDPDGRIIYVNKAYCSLIRADEPKDIKTIERLFAADPEASEPLFRLGQAAREGRELREEIRTLAPLGGGDGGIRWYRVGVRPLVAGEVKQADRSRLSAWFLADVTRERDE